MKKDYKKILKDVYAPKPFTARILVVPELKYLMVSGAGRPDDESFQLAAQTLFPVAYVAKFLLKAARPEEDFTVMPMEVKWKLDRERHGSARYYWTMMIMQPEGVDGTLIEEAVRTLKKKKKDLPYGERLRLQSYNGGLCAQILHVGPYEAPMERTFSLLRAEFVHEGYEGEGDSHDVYFNDIRRTTPDKLKTLMRVRIWKQDEAAPVLMDPFAPW